MRKMAKEESYRGANSQVLENRRFNVQFGLKKSADPRLRGSSKIWLQKKNTISLS
jgi:hypothetical protein